MISVSDLLMAMSIGMDAVEKDFFGAMPYHSKRVAAYSVEIGKILGLRMPVFIRWQVPPCCTIMH